MQLDVFNQDGFSLHALTASFVKMPYKPGRLGELGLFDESGVPTNSVDVESVDGQLSVIQSSPLGSPAPDPVVNNLRSLRAFRIPHFERDAFVYAHEVQGIRAFGQENVLETVQAVVAQKLALLLQAHEVTLEFHRMNALKGILADPNGTTLYNLFTEFGVVQQTQDFQFSSATLDVRNICVAAQRKSEDELGGLPVSGYRAFCSSGFFDALVGHSQVKESFRYQEGQVLRTDLRKGFTFGGIVWEEYRGGVAKPASAGSGSVTFVPTDEAVLVPEAPIYVTRFGPADYEETVNTIGLPRYARQVADPSGLNKYRRINTQSNALCLTTRPRAVIRLTKS